MHDQFISIQLVRIFSSMLEQGEVNLEKSAITLKYAMEAERISSETAEWNDMKQDPSVLYKVGVSGPIRKLRWPTCPIH